MHILIIILLPILNASGQVLMKKAALSTENRSKLILLFFAYSIFLLSTVLTIYVLKIIPTKYFTVILAFNFILTTAFSVYILKEKIGNKTVVGTIFVLLGVGIFSYK
ncbi:EamA family transporter [Solibacillus silvestris]